MFIVTKNNDFLSIEWILLALTSGFFMKEVIQNYFSEATNFKIYDEKWVNYLQ